MKEHANWQPSGKVPKKTIRDEPKNTSHITITQKCKHQGTTLSESHLNLAAETEDEPDIITGIQEIHTSTQQRIEVEPRKVKALVSRMWKDKEILPVLNQPNPLQRQPQSYTGSTTVKQ